MKINFPRITRTFSLSEYVPELDVTISVWVNPPGALRAKLVDDYKAFAENPDDTHLDAFLADLSELLSQGEPATHWTVADLRELIEQTVEPTFWQYFQTRVFRLLHEYIEERKKVLTPPVPS